jgi:tetratricopeptide (TPR) repeat protein
VQRHGQAVRTLREYPLAGRLANAAVSYLVYLRQTFLPTGLAAFYPYPDDGYPPAAVAAAAAALVALTAAALYWGWRWQYLASGWLWYLVALLPVIGLVQVGSQAHADRYSYLPLIGIFVLVAWGGADLAGSWQRQRLAGAVAGVVLAYLAAASWAQAHVWHDSATLWTDALRQTHRNWLASIHVGKILREEGKHEEAVRHFEEALRWAPGDADLLTQLGITLLEQGKAGPAEQRFEQALQRRPADEMPRFYLGSIYLGRGEPARAAESFRAFLAGQPATAQSHNLLAMALLELGQPQEAADELDKAVALLPGVAALYFNLGGARQELGQWERAEDAYRRAAEIQPAEARYRRALAFALAAQGRAQPAAAAYQESLQLDPRWPQALALRAWQLAGTAAVPERALRRAGEDLEQVRQAAGEGLPEYLAARAALRAARGDFAAAAAAAERAAERAEAVGQPALAGAVRERLRLYRQGRAFPPAP